MEADIRRKVGLRVRELRGKAGLSQEAFSSGIGMARTYFAEVESGKRNISIVNVERIAAGFGLSVAEFFDAPAFDADGEDAGPRPSS